MSNIESVSVGKPGRQSTESTIEDGDNDTHGDILIVDDTPVNLRLLAHLLKNEGYRVRMATNGGQGITAAELVAPDLIMLDIMMPDMSGYEVCQHLKHNPATAGVPVIFLSALDGIDDKLEAFRVGGVDYITKPYQSLEVLARVNTHLKLQRTENDLREAKARLEAQIIEIQKLQAIVQEQAIRDSLTGLFNRRYLEDTLERELARAAREKTPISIIMLDIDHFKKLNDSVGHKGGDIMLRCLGDLLNNKIRLGDIPCRYGGEEFIVIMSGATLECGVDRAEELRKSFEETHIRYEDHLLKCTFSAGVSVYPLHGKTVDALIRAADAALYAAKAAGRNQVATAS